jgi:hypothetical protein
MKKTTWPGNWKVSCDVCGFWFPSSDIKKRWDGLMVCAKDWEERHPSTLYKYHDHPSVPSFVRKDAPDTFIQFCTIESSSCYADMATSDCAKADNTQFTYAFLLDLSTNGHT